jgi:probable HAF family extracellular repeat protein
MKKFVPGMLVVFLLAMIAFGCGGGALPQNHTPTSTTGTGTSTTGTTTGSGATGGTLVNAANGGQVTSASGNVVLDIPAKSLPSNTKISINPATTAQLPTLPANLTIVSGTAYELGPDGQFFNIAPTLRIAYLTTSIPTGVSERDFHIYTVINGAWVPLMGCTDDPVNHIVTVNITHFSVYAVVSVQNYSGTPAYDLVDVGTVSGDTTSVPEGLSSSGLAVGISSSASGVHAFMWNQGLVTNLGVRSGDVGARAYCVDASAIAGGTSIQNTIYNFPVLFSAGVVTQVDTAAGQGTGTVTALNDAGSYVVGGAIVQQGSLTAFPSTFSPSSNSQALNAGGSVAGYSNNQAAIWAGGNVSMAPLLTGYDSSVGTAISDAGTLVGTAFNKATNVPIGFIYPQGGPIAAISPISGDNILIPSGANYGAVVGESSNNFTTSRGFIYANGKIADLNTLIPTRTGWTISNAIAINGSGVILCAGTNGSANHALLLVPRPSTTPALHANVKIGTPLRRSR